MTPAEAQIHLKRPLVFGDPEQIKALAVMEEVETAVKAILKCEHSFYQRTERCSCLIDIEPEIIRAAVKDPRIRNDQAWRIRNCL
jgi:hypothetical protein